MKSYLLSIGASAESTLASVFAALSCGMTKEVPGVTVLRVLSGAPVPLTDALLGDLAVCHRLFVNRPDMPFFRTAFSSAVMQPSFPDRRILAGDASGLLLSALRGPDMPLSFRTDREAVEWAFSSLLESEDPSCAPLFSLLDEIRREPDRASHVRVMILCDLADPFSAGLALAVVRFFRFSLGDACPFLGMILGLEALGASAPDGRTAAHGALQAMSERGLIRAADDRPTSGADAAWLLSLPASLGNTAEARRLLSFASARILAEAFSAPRMPSAGMHTREIPGTVAFSALGDEARSFAAFLQGSLWCLSDLFPSLRQYFQHPALLRSLAPATRNGLFRRLFRSPEQGPPEEFPILERTLKVILLEILSALRALPFPLRERERNEALWKEAVRTCGQVVTLASEYDVRRKEAADAGLDQVAPVHRVSMADTTEEEFLRKLDDMAAELSAAKEARAESFRQIGGFRARQALEDCLRRCRSAESAAREKLRLLPSDTPEKRYTLALQERRVRLLEAAIACTEADLQEALKPEKLCAPAAAKAASSFTGEMLDPECAEHLLSALTAAGEPEENLRFLRDHLPSLLSGFSLADAKALLKNLLTVSRNDPGSAEAPFSALMAGICSVCCAGTASLRFPPSGDLPAVPLLPDMAGEDRFFTVAAAPALLLRPDQPDPASDRRGLLAMLLLRQYRRRGAEDAQLRIDPCLPEDSVLSRVYLSSRNAERAWIVSLSRENAAGPESLPFAILLPGIGLEPAFRTAAHAALVPPFAVWFHRETLSFEDPCPFLSEGDRGILTEQLTRLRSGMKNASARSFTDFLSDWYPDIVRAKRSGAQDPLLPRRLKAACGLAHLPAWQKDLTRNLSFYEHSLPEDLLCSRLCSGTEPFPAASVSVTEEVLYTFRSVPFARESADRLLESPGLPEEASVLSSLNAECDLLSHASDDYHEALIHGLEDLIGRCPDADPDALETARSVLEQAREPIGDQATELTWPWDTVSSSVLTILTECLGKNLAPSALRPFSDQLALFPARGGQIIGDALLSRMCVVSDPAQVSGEEDVQVLADAVLPPLSAGFASSLCSFAEGRTLLQEGFLRFERTGGRIRTVLTLEGAFTLRMIRDWPEEEILSLYTHDMPTLALWPSLPFRPEDWHAYFVYAHTPEEYSFLVTDGNGNLKPLSGSATRFADLHKSFPVCFSLLKGESCLGSLPNLLPSPELPVSGNWTACLDFGSSGSSIIFSSGEERWPIQGPDMVRTLLHSPSASDELLWREFMPAIPLSPILPGALRIFRNAAAAGSEDAEDLTLPFRDGSILLSSSLRDVLEVPSDALYTDLKWNAEKGRAAGMYLHQLMLMVALQARCGGAASLGWRAAVPDEMAAGGRESLVSLLDSLSLRVSAESGLPLPPKSSPVSYASESAALGAYFRLCSPDETRGGFLLLDLGADTADISLFLRGRESAVRTCQLPMGVHYMLLPGLLKRPEILTEDFGFISDPLLQHDLGALRTLLESARTDAASLRQSRYALDAFIADYAVPLHDALAQRMASLSPGRTGALLLLHFSYLMMLAGLVLLQISEDPGRNDFLPEQMSLCLSGRGAALMEALSDRVKTSLWRILTMFRNPKVSSLSLLFSTEKKLEIPVGLSCLREVRSGVPQASAAPVSISVRPEELLPEFLRRFRREFPAEAQLLFPEMYSNDPYAPFTPQGLQLISEALHAVFHGGDSIRPYSALTSCLATLLEQ